MTSLRFVGDLSIWIGLAIAAVVCVLSWRYYRRESFDLPHRLRWFLPLLRSLAFFLGVLVLTGPVLHHRKIIGELGNVKIYVDASQSMGLLDRHAPVGRKLLIAEQQGWLAADRIDGSLLDLANQLGDIRRTTLQAIQSEDITTEQVRRLSNELLAQLTKTRDALTDESTITPQMLQPLATLASSTDQAAVDESISQLTSLCEVLAPTEQQLRDAFESEAQLLVDSTDESVRAALAMFDETPRWRRAERSLLNTPDALFADLKQHHNVEVIALHNQQPMELLDGLNTTETPSELPATPDAATTDLTSGITSSQDVAAISTQESTDTDAVQASAKTNTAIVLLTDGQHNSGSSPLQTARMLGEQGIPFYTVSYGEARQAPDLAVTGLEHPETVFRKDRVRGAIIVRDRMPVGQPLVAEISHDGEVLWQQQLLTQNTGERRIEFEFGIGELVDRLGSQLAADVKQHAIALALTARIAPLHDEAEPNNNQRTIRLAAITQNYRLLMLDGRSRWETRYLRNVFERDTQWNVNVVIAGQGTDEETLPRGKGSDQFPETRDELFEYDLIIFGEVDATLFVDHELTWIREFVETRGGGIVFIDGQRGRLRQFTEQNLGPLFPVEWLPTSLATQPTILQLTDKGSREPALTFELDSQANQRFWNELPAPHTITNVTALPGAEVLVEAVVDGSPLPAIVTRSYGAGRVLYLACDETWRWRYKAADTYHQRIWNQLAKYVMPRPFSTSDEFVSVDTGPVSYQNGASPDVRIRLLGLDGKPATDATVDALVWKNGRVVSTIGLTPDADVPGIYRGRSGSLDEGEYEVSVRASGYSQDALKARSQFVVLPVESSELENTASNEALLQQMAAESGGVFLREEQMGKLSALLSPLSNGRVVETDTLLWQSYWWFAAIIFLLTLEWFLRKRAGLL
ncbi:MAG: VWA domain-containing protein [Planctomycetaceae bacterium]|nr:VWA domain-containing protein [Planctomycetales bacterium]MCB9941805.1 VWA domain-containing protein [Planctomycetaceae bacterium]